MQPIKVVGWAKARLRRLPFQILRSLLQGWWARLRFATLRQPANFRFDFQTAKDNSVVERSSRVPDAVQRSSRCTAEPGPTASRSARWAPDQQHTTPQDHSASKTRVNALMALCSIRGTHSLSLP